MPWGKSQEERDREAAAEAATVAARREAAAAKQAADAKARADAVYAASPVGQAKQARANGQGFFQIELEVSKLSGAPSFFGSSDNTVEHTGRPDVLGQIEDAGWRLEHAGYVFMETGSTSTDRVFGTGEGTVIRGSVVGIYLFRAV
jgi:hypothetical protein